MPENLLGFKLKNMKNDIYNIDVFYHIVKDN